MQELNFCNHVPNKSQTHAAGMHRIAGNIWHSGTGASGAFTGVRQEVTKQGYSKQQGHLPPASLLRQCSIDSLAALGSCMVC